MIENSLKELFLYKLKRELIRVLRVFLIAIIHMYVVALLQVPMISIILFFTNEIPIVDLLKYSWKEIFGHSRWHIWLFFAVLITFLNPLVCTLKNGLDSEKYPNNITISYLIEKTVIAFISYSLVVIISLGILNLVDLIIFLI